MSKKINHVFDSKHIFKRFIILNYAHKCVCAHAHTYTGVGGMCVYTHMCAYALDC